MKRQITVKVDHDIERAVDELAAKLGLSRTEFVRQLIGESLAADKEDWTCNGFVPVTDLIMPLLLRMRAG